MTFAFPSVLKFCITIIIVLKFDANVVVDTKTTRKHPSRMRTARFSGWGGGSAQSPLNADPRGRPHPPDADSPVGKHPPPPEIHGILRDTTGMHSCWFLFSFYVVCLRENDLKYKKVERK